MSIRVVGDKILVKETESKTEGRGGIVIPDSVKTTENERGEVISVGEGQYLSSGQCATPRVKVGDKLFYNKFAAIKISHNNIDYKIITESDILFIEE